MIGRSVCSNWWWMMMHRLWVWYYYNYSFFFFLPQQWWLVPNCSNVNSAEVICKGKNIRMIWLETWHAGKWNDRAFSDRSTRRKPIIVVINPSSSSSFAMTWKFNWSIFAGVTYSAKMTRGRQGLVWMIVRCCCCYHKPWGEVHNDR